MSGKYLEFIKKYDNIVEGLMQERDSDLLVQFAPIRKNVLSFIDFGSDESVLELGSQCGVLTGLLASRTKQVVSVEMDEDRLGVNRQVNAQFNNVDYRLGGIEQLQEVEMFDSIVLIGTSEWPDDEVVFFCELKKHLKIGGKMVLAVDNVYSALEFCSFGTQKREKGFSKYSLLERMREIGLNEAFFYYPLPNYRFPVEIYSEHYLPTKIDLHKFITDYENERFYIFEDNKLLYDLVENGLFEDYTNSYVMICS